MSSKPKKKAPLGVAATKPVAFLHKPVKADFSSLIKALGKAATDLATTQWEKLGNDFIDASFALGLETQPEELAFLLVHRAMSRAVIDLVGESINLLPAERAPDAAALEKTLENVLQKLEFSIDSKFFLAPAKFKLLESTQQLLGLWFRMQGVPQLASDAITRRFPAYFVYALHYELGRNRKNYEPLLQAVDTPAVKAAEREWAWHTYATFLERQTHESVFDEPFSLRQIYIPLRAAYHEERRCSREEQLTGNRTRQRSKRKVVDLQDELAAWLQRNKREDAIRILSGGPGSGKSVFARIFAADIAAKQQRVLVIPLHLIDPERDVADEVGRFARQEGVLGHHPLDPDNSDPDLLLIFDGLDELAGQGKSGFNAAREFVCNVERLVERCNMQKLCLRVILSGRELVVQENESLFQHPGQILDLLPYFVSESERGEYQDPKKQLAHDYRTDWWKNYGALTGCGYTDLPTQLKVDDLLEITQQPLLNYLVALTFSRGKIGFASELNLNTVYADLVERVHERGYEGGRSHAAIRHMRFEDFRRVLEEIGLASWHGDGRSTTVGEIRQHCEASSIDRLLDSFQEGAERGVTRLLAAFFFRRYGERASGDQTFVFTHKSFGEYLTVRRIVLAMRILTRDVLRRDNDPDDGCDERTALEQWARICGPSALTPYLVNFIRREVALESNETATEWQNVFTRLFNSMLCKGLPMERLSFPTFREALRQSNNAEVALIVVMNACARVTRKLCEIDHADPSSFGTWLRRIQGQWTESVWYLAAESLSYLNLSGIRIFGADLFDANLENSDLSQTLARVTCLEQACLRGANLSRAYLRGANLRNADLEGANLTEAILIHADLRRANFNGVIGDIGSTHRALLEGVQPKEFQRQLAEQARQEQERIAQHANHYNLRKDDRPES